MKFYFESNPNYQVKLFAPDSEDYVFSNTFKIRFNNSISNVALFPDKKLLKNALDWADIVHIHEPFIPIIFWKLPKDKNYITTHHASLSNIYLKVMKFFYYFRNIDSVSTHVSPLALSNALTLNKNTTLSKSLQVQGFPTIKFFDQNGKIIGNYNKNRDKQTIIEHICKVYHHCINYH